MLGHRGVRLGISYPEITEMQVRAILEAAAELIKAGKKALPEIMVPVTCTFNELSHQKVIVDRVYKEVCASLKVKKIPYLYGTMIEIAAGGDTRAVDGSGGRFLQLRDERPDADELWLQPGRHRRLSAQIPRSRDLAATIRSRRSTPTASANSSAWA